MQKSNCLSWGLRKHSFVGSQSLGHSVAPQRGVYIARASSAVFFVRILRRSLIKPPFPLCWPCSGWRVTGWVRFHLSTLPYQRLVAKDCIHQLPRWKANKSFQLPGCPTPALGMNCNVMSELSMCLEPSVTPVGRLQKQPLRRMLTEKRTSSPVGRGDKSGPCVQVPERGLLYLQYRQPSCWPC